MLCRLKWTAFFKHIQTAIKLILVSKFRKYIVRVGTLRLYWSVGHLSLQLIFLAIFKAPS